MKLKDIQQQLQRYKKPILWVLAVIALVAFTGLFEYIGGKIIYAVYDISQEPHWNTAWHYLQRYGHSQNKRLKLLVWFAALLPLIVLTAGGLLIALSQKQRALFGDARFATMAEVRQAGLLPDKDHRDETILVGKFKGQYLRYGGYQFVMLAAPTRSGKGVGIVIPNCITYTGSLVVLDIKLENFDITAGYRQKALGQKVYLFAPFDPNGRTHRWNPISYISEDPSNRMGDIDAIANALYNNPNAKDPFWDNMAKDMFRACCLAVIETPENLKPHTLGQIIREASAGIDNLKFLLDARVALAYEDGHIKRYGKGDKKEGQAIEVREAGPQPAPKEGEGQNILLDSKGKRVIPGKQPVPTKKKEFAGNTEKESEQETDQDKKDREEPPHYYYSDACRRAIKRMTDMPEQTFGSVKSSFQSPLLAFENPRVDAATSANDFDLRDVRRRKMTIYLGITPDKLAEAAVIVNLFFDQLLNQNTRTLPKQDKSLKYQCLMILDEFTAIGKVNMIAKSISYQAGYNMRVLTIIQNKSQLEDVYGKSGAVTLMSNHALMIMYAPSPVVQSDAKEYSEMLGDTTVKSKSKSHSYSKQSSHSDSVSDQKRALMLPQEIKEIGRWREIVSLENCKPIFCDKIKYFEDPDFTDKINWKLDDDHQIPVIDVKEFVAELENRLRPVNAEDKDPNKLAGADKIPVTQPTAEDAIKAMSQASNLFDSLFKSDGTLTEKGEQHAADVISKEIIRDQNGHAMGAEGIKKLDLSMGRMNKDKLRRMTPSLKSSWKDEDEAFDASELPGTPEPESEPAAAEQAPKPEDNEEHQEAAAPIMPDASEVDSSINSMFNDDFFSGSSQEPEEQPAAENAENSKEDEYMSGLFGPQASSPAAESGKAQEPEDPDALTSQELTDIVRGKDDDGETTND